MFGDFVAYRVKSSLESFLSKLFVERGEPLRQLLKRLIPQGDDYYVIEFAIKPLTAVADHSACFNHGH